MNSKEKIFLKISHFTLHMPISIKMIQLMNEKPLPMKEICRYIHLDTGLYFLFLKSYYLKYPSDIIPKTEEMIKKLGFTYLKNITFQHIRNSLPISSTRLFETKQGQILSHSYSTMVIAQKISKRLLCLNEELILSGALLHDIGKLVQEEIIHRGSCRESSKIVNKEGLSNKIQQTIQQYSHDQLGGELLKRLKFPESLSHIVQYHHNYKNFPENRNLLCVCLANEISNMIGFTTFYTDTHDSDLVFLMEKLSLSELEGELIISESIEEIKNFIDICSGNDDFTVDSDSGQSQTDQDHPYGNIFDKRNNNGNNHQ